MNYQDLIFYDFETTGKDPTTCQPIQLAAVVIHGRKLEIQPNSLFSSFIQPIWNDEECVKCGLKPYDPAETKKFTGIEKTDLDGAPTLRTVWEQFQQYVKKYNPKKSKWGAPLKAGMNIDRYDNIIVDRICGGHLKKARKQLDLLLERGIIEEEVVRAAKKLDPYGFGPWDEERQEETLFYPRDSVDLMRILWMWTENMTDIKSISMDSTREWLGISKAGAHNAAKDVNDGAQVLIKFLKLHRSIAPKTKFKGTFAK